MVKTTQHDAAIQLLATHTKEIKMYAHTNPRTQKPVAAFPKE